MIVEYVKPIGYCLGVVQAINTSLKIRKDYPNRPIYVFGLLVHNEEVTKRLDKYDIKTIDTTTIDVNKRLKEFTKDDIVIFTAHGHPKEYEDILNKKGVLFFDTTCSRVKENLESIEQNKNKRQIIFIGKQNHPETIAALSRGKEVLLYDNSKGFDYSLVSCNDPLVINQTTLSFLEIEDIHNDIIAHLPKAIIEDEICNATRIRQKGLMKISDDVDLIIVIGSTKSSNTMKLYEIATKSHRNTCVVNSIEELQQIDLLHVKKVVLASGTSASLETIEEIRKYLEGK